MGSVVKAPKKRFPEFNDSWEVKKISQILSRVSNPVDVNPNGVYREIGIKSHGKGIFHKDPIQGSELGNKRVFWVVENALVMNIVFAWEQAISKTTVAESGMIASHRFPMYLPLNGDISIDFLYYLFLTSKGKNLLELASPGGAGRNKTLGQQEFEKLKLSIPSHKEQLKITNLLREIDNCLRLIEEKKSLMVNYKEGVWRQILKKKISFASKGKKFAPWKKMSLSEILTERKDRNNLNRYNEVFSVAKEKGVVNQIEHLGRSYASGDISNYKVVFPHDVVYTKSPTSGFPFGIIKQNKTGRPGVVSVLYGVFQPKNKYLGGLIENYFSSEANTFNYLVPLVHRGAKNTMNIGNNDFLNGAKISLPQDEEEQSRIVAFFNSIDENINLVNIQIQQFKLLRKGFLQTLFIN